MLRQLILAAAPRLIALSEKRPPDVVIGGNDNPYMRRWWLIPRNRIFNIYLHHFLRSDDDRALHDHPWWNLSVLLRGRYVEHTISAGGVNIRTERRAGQLKFRIASSAHRIELFRDKARTADGEVISREAACWTFFITGPTLRSWGFHCPKGWVHWREFTKPENPGEIGRGCGENQ